jgi:hypothetical protein
MLVLREGEWRSLAGRYRSSRQAGIQSQGAGIIGQGFALVGTFVGVTLLLTVGPRTALDIVIHFVMVIVLVIGLLITVRAPRTIVSPEGGSTGEAGEGEFRSGSQRVSDR